MLGIRISGFRFQGRESARRVFKTPGMLFQDA